jgi:hypothetical protein
MPNANTKYNQQQQRTNCTTNRNRLMFKTQMKALGILVLSLLLDEAVCFLHSNVRTHARIHALLSTGSLDHRNNNYTAFLASSVRGPPQDTKPDYENIVGPLGRFMDRIFLTVFRLTLDKNSGITSTRDNDDYQGLIEIALAMNRKYPNRTEVQTRALVVLKSLFPSWMPPAYTVLFSRPFPNLAARMNAWATKVAGTWLMGKCETNNVDAVDNGSIGVRQGLLVERCRFLETSGCASVCVNSCKIPTQTFFMQEMGLALTMEPNYETFECQFSFGKTPDAQGEALAKNIPCLSRCTTAGSLRKFHDNALYDNLENFELEACRLMDDPSGMDG